MLISLFGSADSLAFLTALLAIETEILIWDFSFAERRGRRKSSVSSNSIMLFELGWKQSPDLKSCNS